MGSDWAMGSVKDPGLVMGWDSGMGLVSGSAMG